MSQTRRTAAWVAVCVVQTMAVTVVTVACKESMGEVPSSDLFATVMLLAWKLVELVALRYTIIYLVSGVLLGVTRASAKGSSALLAVLACEMTFGAAWVRDFSDISVSMAIVWLFCQLVACGVALSASIVVGNLIARRSLGDDEMNEARSSFIEGEKDDESR